MANNKGITLIALVITIIVLLILAGVSIAMLTGQNGILTQANNSKSATVKAEAVEKINLTLSTIKSSIYEKQVTNSAYNATSAAATDVVDIIKQEIASADLNAEDSKTAVEGKYTYHIDASTVTIKYVNAAQGVTELTGTISLTSPYKITAAQ